MSKIFVKVKCDGEEIYEIDKNLLYKRRKNTTMRNKELGVSSLYEVLTGPVRGYIDFERYTNESALEVYTELRRWLDMYITKELGPYIIFSACRDASIKRIYQREVFAKNKVSFHVRFPESRIFNSGYEIQLFFNQYPRFPGFDTLVYKVKDKQQLMRIPGYEIEELGEATCLIPVTGPNMVVNMNLLTTKNCVIQLEKGKKVIPYQKKDTEIYSGENKEISSMRDICFEINNMLKNLTIKIDKIMLGDRKLKNVLRD